MATKKKGAQQSAPPSLFGKQSLSPWRNERRLAALARQMEMIARIHSGEVERLQLTPELRSPGGSDGGIIHLNQNLLPSPVSRAAIATWIGVTMHEVGHCRWSPPEVPHADQHIYNLLEDPRQEALLVDKLPGTVAPLTRAVADLIIDANDPIWPPTPAQIWPLVAGRIYLPDKLRQKVYDGSVGQMGRAWTDEVRQVVLEYCTLLDPGFSEVKEAQRLIARMKELLDELPRQAIQVCYSHGGVDPDIDAPMMPFDPVGANEDTDDDGGGEGDGDAGSSEGDDESQSGDKGGQTGGEGDGSDSDGDDDAGADGGGNEEQKTGESKGKSKEESDASDPGGAGAGGGDARKTEQESLKDGRDLHREAKEVAQEAAEDMARIIDTVMDRTMGDEFAASALDTTQKPLPVSHEARMVVARLMSALKPLTDQAEAGLDKMTATGRLRPDRIARGYRPDHVFDKWQLDLHDAVSAEIVVAVDVSGSMVSYNRQLTEAVWVMRQVAARTSAKLTVLAWDNRVEVVTSPLRNDVAWSPYRGGGTSGAPMLRTAIDILAQSRETRKWLLIMTDGDVIDDVATKTEVRKLKNYPDIAVTPIGFGYHSKPETFGDNAQKIRDLMDIPKVIGAMLYDLYRKNIVR